MIKVTLCLRHPPKNSTLIILECGGHKNKELTTENTEFYLYFFIVSSKEKTWVEVQDIKSRNEEPKGIKIRNKNVKLCQFNIVNKKCP